MDNKKYTCAICEGEATAELYNLNDCMCRLCNECEVNIKIGGVSYAEQVAEDKIIGDKK